MSGVPESEEIERFWSLVGDGIAAQRASGVAQQAADKEDKDPDAKAAARRRRRRVIIVLDVVSVVWWSYVTLQILGLDPLRGALGLISDDFAAVANYRYLFFLVVLPLASAIFWKVKMVAYLLYVLFFPLVVVFWKAPKLILRARDWSVVMAVANGIGLAIRNFRYGLVSKCLLLLAVSIILLSSSSQLLYFAALLLLGLLSWATVRTIRRTFERSWFLKSQIDAIDTITSFGVVKNFMAIKKGDAGRLPDRLEPTEASQIATAVSLAVAINKSLYFWAYQLKQYRQTRLGVIFDVVAYVWLFIGAVGAFGMANVALNFADASQYSNPNDVGGFGFFLYGASTLMFGGAGGVTAVGDAASGLALVGGLYGVCILAIVALDLLLTVRRERDDAALDATVDALKSRARDQDKRLRRDAFVGVDEAARRMEQIGFNLFSWLLNYVSENLPDGFED